MFRSSGRRRLRNLVAAGTSAAAVLLMAAAVVPAEATATPPPRPQGPCDIFGAPDPTNTLSPDGTPCVAAHSTTRALYAGYNGPLYQVERLSDGAVRNIGVVQPSLTPVPDAGGYADAAAQDAFCVQTTCLITKIYDQSGNHNDLTQAPRGIAAAATGGDGIKPGPALGGQDNLPIADMAPITISGHKAYGVFIEPGMGLRDNSTYGIPNDDQAEGMYMVVDGQHYNAGCCFDYGNAAIESRDDGNGTMEAVNFSNRAHPASARNPHSFGQGNGPWVMSDQENTLVGCANPVALPTTPTGRCPDGLTPAHNSRFVTALVKGKPGGPASTTALQNWAADAGGRLTEQNDGRRFDASYIPMQKQGAIILGTGGDNSNASIGTFYEGVIVANSPQDSLTDYPSAGFPSNTVDNLVQANIRQLKYDVQRLSLVPTNADGTPGASKGVQTFTPGSSHDFTETFTNTTGSTVSGGTLALSVPAGWTSVIRGGTGSTSAFGTVDAGQTATATFTVTAGATAFDGDIIGNSSWTAPSGLSAGDTTTYSVRDTQPIKINEFRVKSSSDPTDSFIELYNAGDTAVDVSGWTVTEHPTQQAASSTVSIPAGTTLASHAHYLLGLATSGLAAAAAQGATTVYLRDTTGLSQGDAVQIGGDQVHLTSDPTGAAAAAPTTLWQPLPDGAITVPANSDNVPVTSTAGFVVGQKVAIGSGATTEIRTVTAVGTPGTQTRLVIPAASGSNKIKVSSATNIRPGDTFTLDIGARREHVTVASVGTPSTAGPNPGTVVTLTDVLQFAHSSGLPFSDRGTGISFAPVTGISHSSDESVQALGLGVSLDQGLSVADPIDTPVVATGVTTAGYQGPTPDQWFGGPALSAAGSVGSNVAGSMVLRTAQGVVADSLNWGDLVDPWLAEGVQPLIPNPDPFGPAVSSTCIVNTPPSGRSAAREPDGADTDSNCLDFHSGAPTPGAPN